MTGQRGNIDEDWRRFGGIVSDKRSEAHMSASLTSTSIIIQKVDRHPSLFSNTAPTTGASARSIPKTSVMTWNAGKRRQQRGE